MTYNPLDKENLAKSVANAFLVRPMTAFPTERFQGAGVYALYYTGQNMPYDLYEPIKVVNSVSRPAIPIYLGRSVSQGARKGKKKFGDPPGPVLYNRLRIHAASIKQAINLNVNDFLCRYIIIDEIWVPLAESLLITTYAPVWNQAIDGFGIKTPGKGRVGQKRSEWDVLHPGRGFASNLATAIKTEVELRDKVRKHIDQFVYQESEELNKKFEFKTKDISALAEIDGEYHISQEEISDGDSKQEEEDDEGA